MKSVKTMRSGEDGRRYSQPGGKSRWFTSMVLPVLVMFALIFGAFNLRISFNQKAEQANRDIARVRSKIHQLDREIANLKNRREELSSWPKIREKIVRYRLGLRAANPDQVYRIDLPSSHRVAEGIRRETSVHAQRTARVDF